MSDLANLSALNTDEAKQLRLYRMACGALGVVLAYNLVEAKTEDFITRVLGVLILFLAVLPSLDWIKSTDKRFPLIEVLLLTTANSYAIPILNGHEEAGGYPQSVIVFSAVVVIAFQIAIIATYRMTGGLPKITPPRLTSSVYATF